MIHLELNLGGIFILHLFTYWFNLLIKPYILVWTFLGTSYVLINSRAKKIGILFFVMALFSLLITSNFMFFLLNWFNSLPDIYKPVVLTASATLAGAFIGACFAQWVSHELSSERERQKYLLEVYQNFHAPIISKLYTYFEITTHYNKEYYLKSELNEKQILSGIMLMIGDKLQYASQEVIKLYNQVQINECRLDDNTGYFHDRKKIELLEAFLIENGRL